MLGHDEIKNLYFPFNFIIFTRWCFVSLFFVRELGYGYLFLYLLRLCYLSFLSDSHFSSLHMHLYLFNIPFLLQGKSVSLKYVKFQNVRRFVLCKMEYTCVWYLHLMLLWSPSTSYPYWWWVTGVSEVFMTREFLHKSILNLSTLKVFCNLCNNITLWRCNCMNELDQFDHICWGQSRWCWCY